MPRVKIVDQIGVLERQESDLLAKLKETRKKAKQKQRAALDQKALIAGRAILAELAEKPKGSEAAAVRTILTARLTRREDRAAFDLAPLLAKPATGAAPAAATSYPKLDPAHAVERVGPALPPSPAPSSEQPAEGGMTGFLGGLAAKVLPRSRQT